jgi:hypothetical protein
MRRTVVILVACAALSSALLLSGCSGGASTTETTPPATTPPPAPAAAAAPAAAPQVSTPPITDPRPFPQVNALTAPPAVLDALKNKRAFFLVYYDPAQSVTVDQQKVVSALKTKFKGLIEFIAYDLPKTDLASTDAEKKQASQVAELGQRLNIGFMPAIVIVTRDNMMTWQSTGYQDAGPLEREILRATR